MHLLPLLHPSDRRRAIELKSAGAEGESRRGKWKRLVLPA